jgi:hypothetical protein
MTTFTFTSFGTDYTLTPEMSTYTNGRPCLNLLYWDDEMQCWAPFATITTNLPDQHLNEGEVFVKDWSENEEIVAYLVARGILTPTGREVISGFVAPQVMRLDNALFA